MAVIQIRDVPEDIAEAIAEKANAEHKSVAAYLRDLMAADTAEDRRRKAMRKWVGDVKRTQKRIKMKPARPGLGAELVRELRDEYDRDEV